MLKTQRTYCVSHARPLTPQHLIDYTIGIGDYSPAKGAHISTLSTFWHLMRPLAYGAAGNYAVGNAIRSVIPSTELTGIFSHRKMVVRSLIGRPAARYPVFREISVVESAQISIEETQPRAGFDILIGEPVRFPKGIAGQYADFHHAIDFEDYVSMASQLGVLTSHDEKAFRSETTFVPGGCELGIYPTTWLETALAKLAAVGREFITRRADRIRTYDSYQIRAVGFLAERLGSFLLMQELRGRYPRGIPRECIGNLCVIVPEGTSYSAATANS